MTVIYHEHELRRALAGLIQWARSVEPTAPIAEICDAEEALGATPRQAMEDFQRQVDMVAGEKLLHLVAQKDAAYSERNQCVALMARMAIALGWLAWVAQHPADDTSWEDDWRTILFIELPTGQASWHFHDSERRLLEGLPRGLNTWDGHTTAEKYARVREAR